MQTIHSKINTSNTNQQALFNLFAAYLHTIPLEELIHRVERARRDAQLRHVVLYGATCSYCLSRAKRLDGSYLRAFALELKEQLALTFAACVTSILTQPHHLDREGVTQPPLRQIVEMLQHVMCTHDAEKLAISVLEICEDGYCDTAIFNIALLTTCGSEGEKQALDPYFFSKSLRFAPFFRYVPRT